MTVTAQESPCLSLVIRPGTLREMAWPRVGCIEPEPTSQGLPMSPEETQPSAPLETCKCSVETGYPEDKTSGNSASLSCQMALEFSSSLDMERGGKAARTE